MHYDSEPFEFVGVSWRLTFGRTELGGYRLLIRPLNSVEAKLNCEFQISCLLKPVFVRRVTLRFEHSPHWQGLDPFIGPELLTYVQDGKVTLSVRLTSIPPLSR